MAGVNRNRTPRVVVIGAGFGGLWAARTLAQGNVDALVIDRNNYHTFLALLYQVAAAELEAEDIAYPSAVSSGSIPTLILLWLTPGVLIYKNAWSLRMVSLYPTII